MQIALATWATDQLVTLVKPEELLEDALPGRAAALAAPLATAVSDFVREKVEEFLATDRFAELWRSAVSAGPRGSRQGARGRRPQHPDDGPSTSRST